MPFQFNAETFFVLQVTLNCKQFTVQNSSLQIKNIKTKIFPYFYGHLTYWLDWFLTTFICIQKLVN